MLNIRNINTNMNTVRKNNKINAYAIKQIEWQDNVPQYVMPDEFRNFMETLDARIQEVISMAKPDMFNDEFFDRTIECEVDQALNSLRFQKGSHEACINDVRISIMTAKAILEQETERLIKTAEEKYQLL